MDISAYDAALRIMYLPVIRKQLVEKTILSTNIKRDTKRIDASGKFARLVLNYQWEEGIGARAESADLPGNVDAGYVNSDVYMKYNYGRIKITGPVSSASRDAKGAAAKALSTQMASLTTSFRNDINRQFFGDGYGALGQVSTGSNDATYTTYTIDSTKYLKAGMKIDSYSAKSGGTIGLNSVTVYDVPSSTTFRIAEGSETVIDSDYIFREDARDNEIMGLLGIIDDEDYRSTLQGIDRSSGAGKNWWRAKVQDSGGLADLKLSDLQDAWTKAEQEDGATKFIISTFTLRDAYADLLVADRRYVNTLELKGGFKGLAFNDVPIVPDKDAIGNTMFFIDPSTLNLFVSKDANWIDDDGHILSRVSNKDVFEASLRIYENLGTDNPSKNVVLRNVQ